MGISKKYEISDYPIFEFFSAKIHFENFFFEFYFVRRFFFKCPYFYTNNIH